MPGLLLAAGYCTKNTAVNKNENCYVRYKKIVKKGTFKIWRGGRGIRYFTLEDPDGNIIANGEFCSDVTSCAEGIAAVKRYAFDADVKRRDKLVNGFKH